MVTVVTQIGRRLWQIEAWPDEYESMLGNPGALRDYKAHRPHVIEYARSRRQLRRVNERLTSTQH